MRIVSHIVLVVIPWSSLAAGLPAADTEQILVTAHREQLLGVVDSASQGTVIHEQLENRPVSRPGEILEVVPGLVVTQHSGNGKANQFFLRGFNLDHGTDFATRVEGIPVNMPTHGHGTGYTDVNFLIPEFVSSVEYKKGTYDAEEGNFSAAGAADVRYVSRLDTPFLVGLTAGEHGFQRALAATTLEIEKGDLLIGLETLDSDGPWTLAERQRKRNGLAKFTSGDATDGFSITAMGYGSSWRATDQIPLRAVQSGQLGRFDAVDQTDGGSSHRYSLSAQWWQSLEDASVRADAYAIDYELNLISNVTYATDQVNGDQYEQYDRRRVYGGSFDYVVPHRLFAKQGILKTGLQLRYDDISPVSLYRTQARARLATVRADEVRQQSYSVYLAHEVTWAAKIRSELGARIDHFRFDVHSNLSVNSGSNSDSIIGPKLAIILGPWAETEFFANFGDGFHSNDARGTTIVVDPNDGVTPADRVDPLVRARGAEIGFRSALIPSVQLAATLWTLEMDSELIFIGDGGTTEAGRGTKRSGVEVGAYISLTPNLIVDADLAWSHARFSSFDPSGDRIPNAIEQVASLGIAYNNDVGFVGGARLRYLGAAPLIKDGSVRSKSTTLVNLDAGYRFTSGLSVELSVFNALNREGNDITYYYESQLPGELAPVSDIHFHPMEPRTVRATLTMRF